MEGKGLGGISAECSDSTGGGSPLKAAGARWGQREHTCKQEREPHETSERHLARAMYGQGDAVQAACGHRKAVQTKQTRTEMKVQKSRSCAASCSWV